MIHINQNELILYLIIFTSAIMVILVVIYLLVNKKERKKLIKESKNMLEEKLAKTLTEPIVEPVKNEIEELLEQMQEDLKEKVEYTTPFEKEQEDNAIISYQELVEANMNPTLKTDVKIVSFEQEQEEKAVISYEELKQSENIETNISSEVITPAMIEFEEKAVTAELPLITKVEDKDSEILDMHPFKEEDIIPEPIVEPEIESPKYRTQEFISPVYGRQTEIIKPFSNEVSTTQIIKDDSKKDSDNQTESYNSFLNELKSFRQDLN